MPQDVANAVKAAQASVQTGWPATRFTLRLLPLVSAPPLSGPEPALPKPLCPLIPLLADPRKSSILLLHYSPSTASARSSCA